MVCNITFSLADSIRSISTIEKYFMKIFMFKHNESIIFFCFPFLNLN